MRVCAIEDRTAVVVVASYCSVLRNPVRFKALVCTKLEPTRSKSKEIPEINVLHKFNPMLFTTWSLLDMRRNNSTTVKII